MEFSSSALVWNQSVELAENLLDLAAKKLETNYAFRAEGKSVSAGMDIPSARNGYGFPPERQRPLGLCNPLSQHFFRQARTEKEQDLLTMAHGLHSQNIEHYLYKQKLLCRSRKET